MTEVAYGLDLGGTAIKFGLIDRVGHVLDSGSVPTQGDLGLNGVKSAFRDALAQLRAMAKTHRVKAKAVGVGVPGTLVGHDGKLVTASPNLPRTKNFKVAGFLRRESKLKAVAENDATVACLGETQCGAGRGKKTVLLATVGTGLGGGLVVDGRLVRGRYGTGAEIGHGIFMPDGELCGCGSRGCLEQYTATRALKRYFAEAGGAADAEVRTIIEMAKAGDRRAVAAAARIGRNLGIGLATAAHLVAPDLILIGGGISHLGPLLVEPVEAAFNTHTLEYVRKTARIARAKLGNDAGIVGAGLLAFAHAT